MVAGVRRELPALDKNVPLTQIKTLSERAAEVTSRTRFIALVLTLFSAVAPLPAAVGIYGVMAYNVSARTRELAIRLALGAQPGDVLRTVMRDGLSLIVTGLIAGLCVSWAAVRVLKTQLYRISASDPATFAAVAGLLALVALSACYFPARKATKIAPITALRQD